MQRVEKYEESLMRKGLLGIKLPPDHPSKVALVLARAPLPEPAPCPKQDEEEPLSLGAEFGISKIGGMSNKDERIYLRSQ